MRLGILGVALLTLAGCDNGTAPPLPPPPPPANGNGLLDIAVLAGGANPPAADAIDRVLTEAAAILLAKTGVTLQRTEIVPAGTGDPAQQASAYLAALTHPPPEAVVVLSEDATATSFGGYSLTVPMPGGQRNEFGSPVLGNFVAYLAVVHYHHKYARCGYDNAGDRIGTHSANGECRNQSGLACVDNGEYWSCPNTSADLYANRDYFRACSVVHELLHPFGSEGVNDHYGTPACRARTGMSAAEAADVRMAQQSCAMCPDLFPRFRRGP